MANTDRRRVGFVVFDGLQPVDIVGPHEAFAMANEWLRNERSAAPRYELVVLAREPGLVRAESGLGLAADRSFVDCRLRFDTVLVAGGGRGLERAMRDDALVGFLRRQGERARRVGSVCSGTFLLAEAGLLDGKRATTHWGAARLLAEQYPKVRVDADPIWVRDGNVYSSAGVTAGIDLALALIEEDLGRETALAVARRMVVFLKRPGGQSQFSAELEAQARASGPLERLPAWIRANLADDLSVDALAAQAGMSPRNFARVFRAQFETTPARYVERARVERARRLLEDARHTLDEVADQCGFGSSERMRKSFQRAIGIAPGDYRARFRAPRGRRVRGAATRRATATSSR